MVITITTMWCNVRSHIFCYSFFKLRFILLLGKINSSKNSTCNISICFYLQYWGLWWVNILIHRQWWTLSHAALHTPSPPLFLMYCILIESRLQLVSDWLKATLWLLCHHFPLFLIQSALSCSSTSHMCEYCW